MSARRNRTTGGERGFSLIEVVLSLGLLAGVLISMTWLFVLGSHHAKSGRTASEALSVARTIIEETQGWGYNQTYLNYGLNGSAASYSVDSRTNSYAAKWQTLLNEKLLNSYALIELESLVPTGTPPALDSADAIGVTVTVVWFENKRERRVDLRMVRM